MIMDTSQQFNMLAAITTIQRVIGDQHLAGSRIGQWQQALDDDPSTEQQQKTVPVAID